MFINTKKCVAEFFIYGVAIPAIGLRFFTGKLTSVIICMAAFAGAVVNGRGIFFGLVATAAIYFGVHPA